MNEESTNPPRTKNPLEWTVFSLSLALLLGTIGVLIHQSIHLGNAPAHLRITLGEPEALADQVRVPVKLHNDGDQPAAAIHIEVTAAFEGAEKRCMLLFDHIAHHSEREGWVSFPEHPSPATLRARVTGYANP